MSEMELDLDVRSWLVSAVSDVFEVGDVTLDFPQPGMARLRGRLRTTPARAHAAIAPRFAKRGLSALLRRDEEGGLDMILAEPRAARLRAPKLWINALLLGLTVVSVLFAGLFLVAPPLQWTWPEMVPGISFAICLLAILMAHEMGHYLVARRVGIKLSLPLFIPFPLNIFGTMGAAEVMEGRPPSRRALLAVGAAGPLAGLALAIPVVILGLMLSEVQAIPVGEPYFVEGNSLLYLALKYLVFGRILPSGGVDVFIHPIAFAGWGGLFVTSLNLIPAGQLDGGHVSYALLGGRARKLFWPILVVLLVLGTQWWSWLVWAFLLFWLGRVHAEPEDDLTPLNPRERALAIAVLVVLVLVFMPIPFQSFGMP
jgi:Zn-dependent protease